MPLINTQIKSKIEVAIIAFQLYHILQVIPRYIKPEDGHEYTNFLTIQICKSQEIYEGAYQYLMYIKNFENIGEDAQQLRDIHFTTDIIKCICGYASNQLPPTEYCRDDIINYQNYDLPEEFIENIFWAATYTIPFEYILFFQTTIETALAFGDKVFAKKVYDDFEDWKRENS